eukprot:10360799-Alexandrium_andersonii.AAC.1
MGSGDAARAPPSARPGRSANGTSSAMRTHPVRRPDAAPESSEGREEASRAQGPRPWSRQPRR